MRAEIDPKHQIDKDLRKHLLQMLMGELINLVVPRYHKMLPGEEMQEGIQRIMKLTPADYAKEDNYDIAANDVSLGGESALALFKPDEAKKACKKNQSIEIDTENFKSKYLLPMFWKDKSEAMYQLTKKLGFGGQRQFY